MKKGDHWLFSVISEVNLVLLKVLALAVRLLADKPQAWAEQTSLQTKA